MSFIKNFFDQKIRTFLNEDSKILEIGCGSYSFFEEYNFSNVLGIDKKVELIINAPESKINYLPMDILESKFENEFDFIFDTHAIHCIVDSELRELALKKIYIALKPNGIFASEMMVKRKSSDSYFSFPDRLIKSTFEVEEELTINNFKIKYFLVNPDLYFLDDISLKTQCDVLQFIAQK